MSGACKQVRRGLSEHIELAGVGNGVGIGHLSGSLVLEVTADGVGYGDSGLASDSYGQTISTQHTIHQAVGARGSVRHEAVMCACTKEFFLAAS
jgi:hypothetical protein